LRGGPYAVSSRPIARRSKSAHLTGVPVDSRISPHFSEEKYKTGSLEGFIDVLEDRIRFWLLAPAKALLGVQFGDVAALSLLLGYFEPYAIYREGEDSTNKSRAFFRVGFIDVFRKSGLEEGFLGRVADLLYVSARCGLFHEGMFRAGIYVGSGEGELTVTVPRVDGKPDEERTHRVCANRRGQVPRSGGASLH
jgi:hypothetical protein